MFYFFFDILIFNLFIQENNGYIPDDYVKGANYTQRLDEILGQLDDDEHISRKRLELDVNTVIGTGNFGDLIRGQYRQERVQVHVISDDMEPLDQAQFLKDFEQILRVARHPNVLSFLGVCQTPDWLYVIFEDTPATVKRRMVEARVSPNMDQHRFSAVSEEFVLRLLGECCDALQYLQSQQVRF